MRTVAAWTMAIASLVRATRAFSFSFSSSSAATGSFAAFGSFGRPTPFPTALRERRAVDGGRSAAAWPPQTNGGDGAEEDPVTELMRENRVLLERLELLQVENDRLLLREQHDNEQQHPYEWYEPDVASQYARRLILEDFEGEGVLAVGGWNGDGDPGPSSSYDPPTMTAAAEDQICEYDDRRDKWITGDGAGECPLEPGVAFSDAMRSRACWLVGLLAMQSCSGFILSRNELLLQDHPVIIYFLTMLVGAGGNAGNQASVRVIRGLALGTLNPQTQARFLSRELRMAFALSAILSVTGFVRAAAFRTPLPETLAITAALTMIVFTSVCLGAVLPLLLQRMGVDPAHSSTTIQVVMDILGVVLTVFVSTLVLDSEWGKMMIVSLGIG